jgi:membrane peptidoglycan carboxypeptidase
MPSLGKTQQDRINTIKRGGLTIETAIDPQTQDAAQEAVSNYVGAKDPIIATMSMIQPGTGLIKGMAQSRPVMGGNEKKGETYYSYPAPPDLGGSSGGFQSGSTFKAITAAAALEAGVSPSKTYNAQSPMSFTGTTWKTCDGTYRQIAPYVPKNSTGVNGVMDMRKAAKYSVNTYFLQLEHTIGLCAVVKMAEKLGVKLASGEEIGKSQFVVPSLTLGVANIAPLSLAEAYATFAARGIHCDPVIIDKIINGQGKEIPAPSANCKRVISKDVADGVNSILQGVMADGGTGSPAAIPDGRPQAGKTGTTNDNQAVWFAGYTPDLAGVASIAEDVTQKPFRQPHVRSGGILGYYMKDTGVTLQATGGGDAGGGIWKPAMTKALKGTPHTKFADYKNSDTAENGMVDVPNVQGMSVKKATDVLTNAGFSVVPTRIYNSAPQGYFVGFSRYGGKAPKYSTIYAYYSAGPAPQPPKSTTNDSGGGGKKKSDKSNTSDSGKKSDNTDTNKNDSGSTSTDKPSGGASSGGNKGGKKGNG